MVMSCAGTSWNWKLRTRKLGVFFAVVVLTLAVIPAEAAETDCRDPLLKTSLGKLLKRDQELTTRQTRLIEKARALPANPPEFAEKLAAHENYLFQRSSSATASSAASASAIESKRAKLDAVIQTHQQAQIIERIHERTQKFKREIARQSVKHIESRRNLRSSGAPLGDRILEALSSYQQEQRDLQKWIQSFQRSCQQIAYLQSAESAAQRPQGRNTASFGN
jgi:hypothetical protein